MTHFADRLTEANRQTGTVLCMGIDPHMSMIPAIFGGGEPGSNTGLAAMQDFTKACLDQAIGQVAAIKPQVGFFEQHGPAGMQVLAELGRHGTHDGKVIRAFRDLGKHIRHLQTGLAPLL